MYGDSALDVRRPAGRVDLGAVLEEFGALIHIKDPRAPDWATMSHSVRNPGAVEKQMSDKAMIEETRTGLLLSGLSEGQLTRVTRRASRMKLDEGQMLFSQGDPADRFYLVLKGQIRLFRLSSEGAEKVIEIVAPGETFAEAVEKGLREQGIIEVNGSRVTILNQEALEEIAEFGDSLELAPMRGVPRKYEVPLG